jgi:hypothetical protein
VKESAYRPAAIRCVAKRLADIGLANEVVSEVINPYEAANRWLLPFWEDGAILLIIFLPQHTVVDVIMEADAD